MLKDNWRWSSDKVNNNNTNDDDQKDVDQNKVSDSISSDLKPEYTVEFYLNKIPTDRKLIDSLAKDRNFAYYQLGLIYKEKLNIPN